MIESAKRIKALTDKINTSTGAADKTLSEAVDTLLESGGGEDAFAAYLEGTLTEYTNDRVTKIKNYAFYNLNYITRVSFAEVTVINASAFANCYRLAAVFAPKLETIYNNVFRDTEIVEVNFPELSKMYGSDQFVSCDKLQTVILPKLPTIPTQTFGGLSSLVKVDLGAVTSIGLESFVNDANLTQFIIRQPNSVATLVDVSAFWDSGIEVGDGYIYVPSALVNSYKAATNWVEYAHKIRALESYTVDGTITGELDESKI